jgi:hypothetical protein
VQKRVESAPLKRRTQHGERVVQLQQGRGRAALAQLGEQLRI